LVCCVQAASMPWVWIGGKDLGGKGVGLKGWGFKGFDWKGWGGKARAGKSLQKGKGQGNAKGNAKSKDNGTAKVSPVVPADFPLDTAKSYTGTVRTYFKFKGYGFIGMDEKDVVPEDRVFVYWTGIQSMDRFPMLLKEAQVMFNLEKGDKNGQTTIRACNVSQLDGAPVSVQDEQDEKKVYVGGKSLRYTGTLKFYNPKRGFGCVLVDNDIELEGGVPKELRVETSEVNAGGKQPSEMNDVEVEFGIWRTKKGAYKVYNMTAPAGEPLPSS